MPIAIRPSNAEDNVIRPFNAPIQATDEERIAYALEFLCTVFVRIDHNLELMTREIRDISAKTR